VLVVVHRGVRTREHETLVPRVRPPHHIGRFAVLAAYLEDLAVTVHVVDVGPVDDEPITD